VLTTEQTNLIEQSAERTYNRHVSDLLAAVEWVKKLDPVKPNPAGQIFEGFLKDTLAAIQKYGEELVSEVIRVTNRVSPVLSKSEAAQLISCCAKYIEPGLYEKRMRLFREALDRSANRYGINIDYKATRFDLFQAKYSAGTSNLIRDISLRLKQELDILALSDGAVAAKPPPDVTSNLGDAINLRPGIFGIGVDLKKAWRWWQDRIKQ